MPGKLKVRIIAGRHLPVMDRASDLTDAFVEVKFGTMTHKTDVFAKSLNPLWNSEWFKFEVDDELLQDEPLQIRVLDHDTYSAHDAIGKVYIDIDPLLHPDSSHFLGGWFPIYDTMHGIRGELLAAVKLELFADVNQFKQSSCGFKFLCATTLPSCYQIQTVHGFISDLIICEDPEYQWIEKLRTPRASNEARQRVFMKMSGELQRKIGSKVENVGGNAVVGYLQSYDIEGDSGIVVRAIGTAVTIKIAEKPRFPTAVLLQETSKLNRSLQSQLSERSVTQGHSVFKTKSSVDVPSQLSDFPFFTMTSYPPGILQRISMVVCARSVKLLEKVHNQEDWETREIWWDELRREILAHCDALSCNAVIGYREETSICDDVIVLSAEGTAAVVGSYFLDALPKREDFRDDSFVSTSKEENRKSDLHEFSEEANMFRAYLDASESVPLVEYRTSPLDGTTPVPELLYSTIDIPNNVHYLGKGTLVQARYCRKIKKSQSEAFASLASDALPFIEYELHRRLHIKVKARGMNAVFGFRSSITLGENLIIGVLTGTAVCLTALPRPEPPSSDSTSALFRCGANLFKSKEFMEMCRNTFELNEKIPSIQVQTSPTSPPVHPGHTFVSDKKSLFVELAGMEDLRRGDAESVEIRESLPPPSCYYSNLDICPGVAGGHEQSLSFLRRFRYDDDADDDALNQGLACHLHQALDSLWFRLRRRSPVCFVTCLRFHIAIPDDDEIQLWITCSVLNKTDCNDGSSSNRCSALPLAEDLSPKRLSPFNRSSSDLEMEMSSIEEHKQPASFFRVRLSPLLNRFRRSAAPAISRTRFNSISSARVRHPSDTSTMSEIDFHERSVGTVAITTMTHVPGRKIRRHIGLFNIFIVRETTAVRGSDETLPMAEPSHGTGCSWFVMRTLAEAQALVRSHVVALGGNALTSYRSSYVVLKESLSKNEAQCLLHIIGDVIELS